MTIKHFSIFLFLNKHSNERAIMISLVAATIFSFLNPSFEAYLLKAVKSENNNLFTTEFIRASSKSVVTMSMTAFQKMLTAGFETSEFLKPDVMKDF